MRVISKSTLRKFWEQPNWSDAKGQLEAWHDFVLKANWNSHQDIKDTFKNASICANNRVVFNISGNKYRLIVEIQYQSSIVWIKFIGTHTEYDKIDVEVVNEY